MKRSSIHAIAVMLTAAVALSGCVDPNEVSEIKSRVANIEAQQKDLMGKIDGLAQGQKAILAKAAAAPAPAPSRPSEDPDKVYDVVVGNSFAKGPQDAPVTIVEFSDFQCPFCAQADKLVNQLIEAFPNDLRFVYKNFPLPFHKSAMPAAKACVAAGRQGKYWEMHEKLFANQRALSDEKYLEWAKELGLDIDKFKADLAAPETAAFITDEMKQAATVAVRGTPTFFINGKKPAGRSFELYKALIEDAIKEKKKG